MQGVYVKNYPTPPVNEREALRYAGQFGEADARTLERLRACYLECDKECTYRVCYAVFAVEEMLSLLGKESEDWLTPRLCGCERVLAFCATVGLGMDRLIYRYANVSPAKGLWMQAIGTERVESLCDAFCADMANEYAPAIVGTRFSPGYGNIPLVVQKDLQTLLDFSRKIGVTVNDSLLMTPTKSVTAFMGIGGSARQNHVGCKACGKQDCAMRKE